MTVERPIIVATRGSALALAQAESVAALGRAAFPALRFELKIIRTTGDKLQAAAPAPGGLPKGLFTKELETALLKSEADLAVHSLKDLPTDLPAGLILAATPRREDAREVLVYRREPNARRDAKPLTRLQDLPPDATLATGSPRRKMALLDLQPAWRIVDLRGNVATRLQKIARPDGPEATLLALAGLTRLGCRIEADGSLTGDAVPPGLGATILSLDEMLPCVGQGAIGIETRVDEARLPALTARLNHAGTFQAVTAERAFLRAMGGGCQSPVAAYAEVSDGRICLRAVSFRSAPTRRAQATCSVAEAVQLGEQVAAELR